MGCFIGKDGGSRNATAKASKKVETRTLLQSMKMQCLRKVPLMQQLPEDRYPLVAASSSESAPLRTRQDLTEKELWDLHHQHKVAVRKEFQHKRAHRHYRFYYNLASIFTIVMSSIPPLIMAIVQDGKKAKLLVTVVGIIGTIVTGMISQLGLEGLAQQHDSAAKMYKGIALDASSAGTEVPENIVQRMSAVGREEPDADAWKQDAIKELESMQHDTVVPEWSDSAEMVEHDERDWMQSSLPPSAYDANGQIRKIRADYGQETTGG